MNVEVHLFVHDAASDKKLDQILKLLQTIIIKENQMALTADDILAKVTATATVEDSVEALLVQIKSMLDAAGSDPVKLQAVGDALDAMQAKAAAAIVANTPSQP